MEPFFSTLLGAFLGVSAPFVISHWLESKAYRRALDSAFVISDTYFQGTFGCFKLIQASLPKTPSGFTKSALELVTANIEAPAPLAGTLAATYSKFMTSEAVFLLAQSDQNLGRIYRRYGRGVLS